MKGRPWIREQWDKAIRGVREAQYYYLEDNEVEHIIKKICHVPTHLTAKEEIRIIWRILGKLKIGEIQGDLETIFKEAVK